MKAAATAPCRMGEIIQVLKQAELGDFNALFFFKPFVDGFPGLMGEKLQDLEPGAVVIANTIQSERAQIFDPSKFEMIFTLGDNYPVRSEAERYATYVRV